MGMVCVGLFVMICNPSGPQPASPYASFCETYRPVYWSARDTRATKEMIDTNNAKWKRLCRRSRNG